jgi:hypothetical protein
MARITVIHAGRSLRVSAEVAENMVRRGDTEIDATDERGHDAWLRHVKGRPGLDARIDLDGPMDMPEGWYIDAKPPWFTVMDEEGKKVGKSQKTRYSALRMAAVEAAARERMTTGNGEE